MMVLVTYDVATSTEGGERRLRRVAKECQNFGQRVQNSVFECLVDPMQLEDLKGRLKKIININNDSLRFYYLGNNYKRKIEHFGAKATISLNDTLIL